MDTTSALGPTILLLDDLAQETSHQVRYLVTVLLKREVSGVEQVKLLG